MACYLVQPRDCKYVKDYGFLSFARNIGKNRKNISKSASSKYIQKVLNYAKQSATEALKTVSKKAIQKTAEATGELISNKLLIKLQGSQKLTKQ